MKQKDIFQVFSGKGDFPFMMAQPIVKDVHNRLDEGVQDALEEAKERTHVVPNRDFVRPSAVCLRNHLTKDHNSSRRDKNSQVRRDNFIQENGQGFQSKGIGE